MAFSERLAAVRKERGFTQKGLAEAAGLSQIQVHRYEKGEAQPTLYSGREIDEVYLGEVAPAAIEARAGVEEGTKPQCVQPEESVPSSVCAPTAISATREVSPTSSRRWHLRIT